MKEFKKEFGNILFSLEADKSTCCEAKKLLSQNEVRTELFSMNLFDAKAMVKIKNIKLGERLNLLKDIKNGQYYGMMYVYHQIIRI